jgi:uncharacterized membrane protein YsdA (DUF1294 family)
MDVCVRLFCVCVVLCVGSALATAWSLVQGVLPTVYRIKKLKKRPRSNKKGLYSHRWVGGWVGGWMDMETVARKELRRWYIFRQIKVRPLGAQMVTEHLQLEPVYSVTKSGVPINSQLRFRDDVVKVSSIWQGMCNVCAPLFSELTADRRISINSRMHRNEKCFKQDGIRLNRV